MGRIYSHLCREERLNLARWREAGIPVVEIAARLGRAPSTLYRELARNRFEDPFDPFFDGYYGLAAERMAEKRRAIQRKLRSGTPVHAAVVDRLKAGWTPEQIAGRMRHEDHPVRVSHETIYRYAYSREGRSEELWRHLPRHRRRRRPRGSGKRAEGKFFPENNISRRPPEIGARTVFGHWECDLMLFRKEFGQANVTSLVERVSRFTVLLRNNDRCSEPVMDGLIGVLAPLPAEARRSVTFDRGTEFSAWARLHEGVGADAWFCNPKAPWQKGTVENTNNRIRRWLPRTRDPLQLRDEDLAAVCARLNGTPRRCLGWRTPAEVFRANVLGRGHRRQRLSMKPKSHFR